MHRLYVILINHRISCVVKYYDLPQTQRRRVNINSSDIVPYIADVLKVTMEPQQYFLDQNTGISYAIVPEVSFTIYYIVCL